ncbi:MAG: protein kinase domain-containing protein [Pseudonocardiaceae bacterium]
MLSGGRLLARRYRLSRRIAVGGMGEVWQATDTRLDRQVAIKVLKPELSGDAEFRHRFHTEARMAASLNHPGIAAVHDYGEEAGDHLDDHVGAYLVMELVAGEPLDAILMRQRRLSAERTLDILRQAGDALAAAHERALVHRDVKPGNILITPEGRVKLTDFGIARAVNAAPVTREGMVLGTAHYIAPERAAGREAGPASDVYSLGVVGYECLAGQRPFVADNAVTVVVMHLRDQPPPLPRDVPPALRALIETALAKDPRQRYGTGGEFAAAAAAVAVGHRLPPPRGVAVGGNPCPATAVLPSPAPHFDPSPRGAPRFALVPLGVLVLALGGYVAREALRAPSSPPAAVRPTQLEAPQREPAQLDPPRKQEPDVEPSDPDQEPPDVLVVPTDYWGHRGSDAVVTAKVHGLIPRVVDDDGELVDPDLRSQCRIIGVAPLAGLVARGSTLELTCRSGK